MAPQCRYLSFFRTTRGSSKNDCQPTIESRLTSLTIQQLTPFTNEQTSPRDFPWALIGCHILFMGLSMDTSNRKGREIGKLEAHFVQHKRPDNRHRS